MPATLCAARLSMTTTSPGWRANERLLDIGAERGPSHRAVEHQGRDDAALAQAGDKGRGAPVAVRHRCDQALAARRPAIKAGHLGVEPGLIEEDEPAPVHVALPGPPALPAPGDIRAVLLGRSQALFLCRSPSRRSR